MEAGELRESFGRLQARSVEEAVAGLASPVRLQNHLVSGQAVLGLYLLILLSEIARRQAQEGRLWTKVANSLQGNGAVRALLFDAGNQPSVGAKKLMERAARTFHIRHAFDVRDDDAASHRYYTTIFLQFGFSLEGFEQNAGLWVRGVNVPKAVRLLHGTETEDPSAARLASQGFRDLYRDLRLFARGVLPRADALSRIERSPWAIAGSGERLLDAVGRKDRRTLAQPESDSLSDVAGDQFLGRTWWVHRAGQLAVRTELCGLAALGLDKSSYDVHLNGKRVARLFREESGFRLAGSARWVASESDLVLVVPDPARPTVTANLVDPDGCIRCEQTLSLWDTNLLVNELNADDVGAGDDGRAGPSPNRPLRLVIMDSCCRCEPETLKQHRLDGGRAFAVALTEGRPEPCRILLGESIVWQEDRMPPAAVIAPFEVAIDGEQDQSFTANDPVGVTIRTRDRWRAVSLWYARAEHKPVAVAGDAARFALRYRLSSTPGHLDFIVVFETPDGRTVLRRVHRDIHVEGFFRVFDGTYAPCDGARPITKDGLSFGRYEFHPPRQVQGDVRDRASWFLFEGSRPLRRLPRLRQPRLRPEGLGAPLFARSGPVNSPGRLKLAPGVVDFGQCKPAHDLRPDAYGAFRIAVDESLLAQVNDLDCVIWDANGNVISGLIVEHTSPADGYSRLGILPSQPSGSTCAIALAYRGVRVGAVWGTRWSQHVRELLDRGRQRGFAVLRWLKLPILLEDALTVLRPEFTASPAALMLAWTQSMQWQTDCGESWFTNPHATTGSVHSESPWWGAVRTTLDSWLPPDDRVSPFLDELIAGLNIDGGERNPLLNALEFLTHVHPRIALGTLAAYQRAETLDSLQSSRLREDLSLRLIGEPTRSRVDIETERLAEASACSLESILEQPIDPAFVHGLAREAARSFRPGGPVRPLPGRQALDIELLCHCESGRRLVMIYALLQT
jgi:hypothetical protein